MQDFTLGTWNVCGLNADYKLEFLASELSRCSVDILTITETHFRDEVDRVFHPAGDDGSSYKLYYSGMKDDTNRWHGV